VRLQSLRSLEIGDRGVEVSLAIVLDSLIERVTRSSDV